MKFAQSRFSVPFCIFAEPMPGKEFRLLAFLLSESTMEGGCSPGYGAMRMAMNERPGDKGSDTTVKRYLDNLDKRGWIFARHRTNGKMRIWLRIPPRFRKEKTPASPISVLHS